MVFNISAKVSVLLIFLFLDSFPFLFSISVPAFGFSPFGFVTILENTATGFAVGLSPIIVCISELPNFLLGGLEKLPFVF
jgi:hypothetical protein